MNKSFVSGAAFTTLVVLASIPIACSSTNDKAESADGGTPPGAGRPDGSAPTSTDGQAPTTRGKPDAGAPDDSGGADGRTPTGSRGPDGEAPTGSGGLDAGLGVGSDGGASVLSCLQILQCVGDCADTDVTCADVCVENGSPDAQTKAGALADCITTESCADVTCIQNQCGPSLTDCVSSSAPAPTGKPLDGTAPKGSVPAELVGTWSRTSYGATDRIVLNADGTGSDFVGIAGGAGGCITINSSTEEGTAVVTADKITIYATKVTNVEKDCSAPSMETQGTPIVVEIAWRLQDPTTLITARFDCVDKYPNDPASVASYCRIELKKQ